MAGTASAQSDQKSAARASLRDSQLEQLVAAALSSAPEIAASRASLEAAQRRIAPAGTLPDPFFSVTYQNDGRSVSFGEAEGSFLGLMGSQTIPWPGKLRLAGRIAESEAREIERSSVSRTELTLEARVRNVWYDLVYARAIDRIIDDRRAAASQIETAVRERYAAGMAVQQDVLRAQVELARLDEQKALQAAAIESRLAEINRLVGAPHDRVLDTPDQLPEDRAVPALQELIAAAATRSPELAANAQAIETGRLRADLARKNFRPDFTVNAGSMSRGSFEMGPMWQAGVGMSIPLWIERRQQNQLAEAQAVVRARQAESNTAARELELRTRERVAQLAASLEVAQLYRDKILPLDELALESALASYQGGKIPFIAVLEALNTLYSDRAAFAARLADSAKWRVAIDEASLQMTPVPSAPAPAAASNNSSTAMNSMR